MPETDISLVTETDLSTAIKDYSVAARETDAATQDKETFYINRLFPQYLGYYKLIPELRAAIDAKGFWSVGKGFEADEETTMLLDTIRGFGKDTFNKILSNMIRTYYIQGDSFCHIVRDDEGNLLNLKPLNGGVIATWINKDGILIRYEQVSLVGNPPKVFQPEDIFHLMRERIADEIHGISVIQAAEFNILARNEAAEIAKVIVQRFAKPLRIWEADTNKKSKLDELKITLDKITTKTENVIIPKGSVAVTESGIAPASTLNLQPYIDQLNDYFFQIVGTPAIILGLSKSFTDASGKIVYLSFEQNIKAEQLYIRESILAQLNLVINLPFPASLQNDAISDTAKNDQEAIQSNDTTAELEGST